MKKTVLALAIAAAAICGISASAQSTGAQQQCAGGTEYTMRGNRHADPFAGITLTEQQKAALEALKPAQCCPDSANAAMKSRIRDNRKQGRREYINHVKNILTPEQYVTFLENLVIEGTAQQPQHMLKGRSGIQRAEGRRFNKTKKAGNLRAIDRTETTTDK